MRVTEVRVSDQESCPQLVWVVIAGVPVEGVIDAAADITIIGAETLKCIASVVRLKRCDHKPVDKTPEENTTNDDRKKLLLDQLQDEFRDIQEEARDQLFDLLGRYHHVFSLKLMPSSIMVIKLLLSLKLMSWMTLKEMM